MSNRMIDVDGASLHLLESGSGRPLLLLSGGAGYADYLEPVANQIDTMATVYRLEPRGCGPSICDGRYDLETTLSDIDAVRESLRLERWIVSGHSHGAFYALAYALAYPERVEAIVNMASTGLQSDRSWSAAYHAGVDAGLGKDVPEELFEVNPDVNRIANASYKEYVRRPNLWREVADLNIPFLAVYGEIDIRPIWPVEQLVALMPNARLHVIPNAPHDFWYTHTNELGKALRKFIIGLA
ncbi:MAG: alpha/beta hydrolase [Thermomicrobiales bacterium]